MYRVAIDLPFQVQKSHAFSPYSLQPSFDYAWCKRREIGGIEVTSLTSYSEYEIWLFSSSIGRVVQG